MTCLFQCSSRYCLQKGIGVTRIRNTVTLHFVQCTQGVSLQPQNPSEPHRDSINAVEHWYFLIQVAYCQTDACLQIMIGDAMRPESLIPRHSETWSRIPCLRHTTTRHQLHARRTALMSKCLSATLFLKDSPEAQPGCCALPVQGSTAVLTQKTAAFSTTNFLLHTAKKHAVNQTDNRIKPK